MRLFFPPNVLANLGIHQPGAPVYANLGMWGTGQGGEKRGRETRGVERILAISGAEGPIINQVILRLPTLLVCVCALFAPQLAGRVGLNAMEQGDVGRVMVVAITDGRANVSLARSTAEPGTDIDSLPKPTQQEIKDEILQVSARIGAAGLQMLVSSEPTPTKRTNLDSNRACTLTH
eukprot:1178815-Prorocentrum_minimum.AAC.1